MKKFKLFLSTIIMAIVAFSGLTVHAAGSYDITINGDTAGHTYEAYQIFKGELSGDTLSNIQWGDGVNAFEYNGSSDAATVAASLNDTNAEAFAVEASKHLTTAQGEGTNSITGLSAGYYLIKDKDNSLEGTSNKAYTSFILKVVKNQTITPKADVPSVIKKVKDVNDTTGVTSDWQDSADHDIDDDVPFQLTASLPSNYDKYKSYYLEFKDTLSSGLTYNNNAAVYLVDGSGSETDITSNFTITSSGNDLKIKINDLKKVTSVTAASKIVVRYTAKLNGNAVIGAAGNPNEVSLVYSNDPNYTGEGENSPKGETPKDKVIVFTFKTVVDKVDQDGKPLVGAEFTLYKKLQDGSEKVIASVTNTEGTQFTFKGLDDGDYILKETKTPAGYNTIADITFTVTATHDIESDDPKLTDLSGNPVSGNISFTKNTTDGSLTTKVENKKGSLLPSTGSVGTTIMYMVGAILVLGAVVLLITKKRMSINAK